MLDSPSQSPPPSLGDDFSQLPKLELPSALRFLDAGSQPSPPHLPRPGLGLAVVIVLAIPLVHLVTTLAYVVAAVPELLSQAVGESLLDRLPPGQLVRLLAFDQGMFVLAAFLGAWWIFGSRFHRAIPINLPAMRHIALICLLVLPLAVMDGFLAQLLITAGEGVFGQTPSQGDLPQLLDGMAQAPTGVLLLILAVLPALGEELVFRGVIGRGLIARHGMVAGILWTSLLFSAVHLNPVQAVGVFFVGVMCHVSYLATRSLIAPMLLHFLNNTLPVLALKTIAAAEQAGPVAAADQTLGTLSPIIGIAAMGCVAALGCLLWKSRVEYLDADGRVIAEDIPSVEVPPEAAYRRCRPILPW